jgi:hypothetical protein
MRAAKVYDFQDAVLVHHNVVELEVAVSEAHAMQVRNAVDYLHRAAGHFFPRHLPAHDYVEKVVRGVLHYFVPSVAFVYYIQGLYDVPVM